MFEIICHIRAVIWCSVHEYDPDIGVLFMSYYKINHPV
jgi:hypothetical protein